jgi:hypothetical protein
MATAYMVTQGRYSDYGVVGVFTTREKAEAFMALFPPQRDELRIEEVELDALDGVPVGRRPFKVKFDKEGNSTSKPCDPVGMEEYCRAYGDDVHMTTDCWAADEQHAVKIANERRVMAIASGDWETNFHLWRQKHLAKA